MPQKKMIYQIKITLYDTDPPIWRRIQVPTSATFWDLHIAIQGVFSWNHTHLHQFVYDDKTLGTSLRFGIPFDDEMCEIKVLPSWKHKISKYLNLEEPDIKYVYDLGDNWIHLIKLEEILAVEQDAVYPRCLEGKRNSPPDDSGGPGGYAHLLDVLTDPRHEEHEDLKAWVESVKGRPFDPEHFSPDEVKFEDPEMRFK